MTQVLSLKKAPVSPLDMHFRRLANAIEHEDLERMARLLAKPLTAQINPSDRRYLYSYAQELNKEGILNIFNRVDFAPRPSLCRWIFCCFSS